MNREELGRLAKELMSPNQEYLMTEAIATIKLYIIDESSSQIKQMAYRWITPYLKKYMIGLMKLILAKEDTITYLQNPIINISFQDLPEFREWLAIRIQQLPVERTLKRIELPDWMGRIREEFPSLYRLNADAVSLS